MPKGRTPSRKPIVPVQVSPAFYQRLVDGIVLSCRCGHVDMSALAQLPARNQRLIIPQIRLAIERSRAFTLAEIQALLLRGGVHPNPGPTSKTAQDAGSSSEPAHPPPVAPGRGAPPPREAR